MHLEGKWFVVRCIDPNTAYNVTTNYSGGAVRGGMRDTARNFRRENRFSHSTYQHRSGLKTQAPKGGTSAVSAGSEFPPPSFYCMCDVRGLARKQPSFPHCRACLNHDGGFGQYAYKSRF